MTYSLPQLERCTINGSAGALEAIVETPATVVAPSAVMVICHPHPLHGGSLHNKVVTTLARTAHELGAATIRFNFRGVGASAGTFDNGVGEVDDAVQAVAFGRQRWPDAKLWLAGFSFGGVVALRTSTRGVGEIARLITVAPALGSHFASARDVEVPPCPWLIVQGDTDEVIDGNVVVTWAGQLVPPPQLAVLPGVGHFFHGQLPLLQQQVTSFLRTP